MTNPITEMVKTPTKKEPAAEPVPEGQVEDMSESMKSIEEPVKDTSLIEIQGNIDLQEQAEGLMEKAESLFQFDTLLQLAVIFALSSVAYTLAMMWQKKFRKLTEKEEKPIFSDTGKVWLTRFNQVLFPGILAIFLLISTQTANWLSLSSNLLSITMHLAVAGSVIVFLSNMIQSKVVAKWVASVVWGIAILHIMGWWVTANELLDSIRFGMGDNKISLLNVIKGVFYFALFLWTANILSRASEKRLKKFEELTPSLRVLLSKLLRITLIVTAFLLGLNAIGVDLTSFAIFGGAIGVGLGFGLQKVVSNFISGIILLLDRSIKPGDVIAVDTSFGWVNTLGARYVSIIQRDGKEHLIPNELLITQKVENWSFSNNDVRIPILIGVSYDSDIRHALELCLEAAVEEPRIKQFPKPVVRVIGFGDNSVNLEIRGWINDPVNGVGNIRSDILLRVWDKFKENGIGIPYPQRDLHIKSADNDMVERIKNELRKELLEEMKGA